MHTKEFYKLKNTVLLHEGGQCFKIAAHRRNKSDIKEQLYEMGAIYASMSGSGSAMFGLFSDDVSIPDCLKNHFIYSGVLG